MSYIKSFALKKQQRSMRVIKNTGYFRNILFGAEDSLVSTVGVLFGVASSAQTIDQSQILMTGLIVISVEALSMGAGAFLTETSTYELSKKSYQDKPAIDGLLMFSSYFLFGLIPITPYVLISGPYAKIVSLGATLVALFILGYIPTKKIKAAIRMVVVAGSAAVIGFIIATLFNIS